MKRYVKEIARPDGVRVRNLTFKVTVSGWRSYSYPNGCMAYRRCELIRYIGTAETRSIMRAEDTADGLEDGTSMMVVRRRLRRHRGQV